MSHPKSSKFKLFTVITQPTVLMFIDSKVIGGSLDIGGRSSVDKAEPALSNSY